MNRAQRGATSWFACFLGLLVVLLTGCDALYQSYSFTESLPTTLPVQVTGDEVWVTSIPVGAEVYIQPYTPDQVPSHATDPAAARGKTPVRFTLPPWS